MEHRWSARKPMEGSVIVDCPRQGAVRADIGNLSLGGMFIETDALLPLNTVVAVGFRLRSGTQFDSYRLHAVVVHRVAEGAGLMFDNLAAEVARAFRSALYENAATTLAPESLQPMRAA